MEKSPPLKLDPCGSRHGGMIKFGKVADLDCTIREACNHLRLTAHGFNMAAQSRSIHVGSFFHFGDGWLLKCL